MSMSIWLLRDNAEFWSAVFCSCCWLRLSFGQGRMKEFVALLSFVPEQMAGLLRCGSGDGLPCHVIFVGRGQSVLLC